VAVGAIMHDALRTNASRTTVAGKHAYARFCCSTGDAMAMNMISKAVNATLDFVRESHLACQDRPAF